MAHSHWCRRTRIRIPNLMAALHYVERVNIAQTQTRIPTHDLCVAQEYSWVWICTRVRLRQCKWGIRTVLFKAMTGSKRESNYLSLTPKKIAFNPYVSSCSWVVCCWMTAGGWSWRTTVSGSGCMTYVPPWIRGRPPRSASRETSCRTWAGEARR